LKNILLFKECVAGICVKQSNIQKIVNIGKIDNIINVRMTIEGRG
jgi:hypothetical protein